VEAARLFFSSSGPHLSSRSFVHLASKIYKFYYRTAEAFPELSRNPWKNCTKNLLLFFPWEVGERKRDKFPHLV
jgi:hypothetical protein